MGATLDSIVAVNISLATAAVQQKGFGRGLILGTSNRFTGGVLYKIYTSAASMLLDSFLTSDPEYLAALSYFSQQITPQDVMVGYAPTDVAQVETLTPTAHDTTLYTVTINGVVSSFTSGSGATATQIVTGLAAAIAAQVPALPVVVTGSSTLILTSSNAGLGFTIAASANIAIAHTTPDTGMDTGLAAILAAGGTAWYGLIFTGRGAVDIEVLATFIEAQTYGYIFIACSQDSAVTANTPGNVLLTLQAKAYNRTAYIWSDNQAAFPEAAWMGAGFPTQPGSWNYAYKTLVGITPTALTVMTPTVIGYIEAGKGNYYIAVAGVNITQKGWMVSGQWIDVIIGRDWIKAQMQQLIFNELVTNPKIGFDDAGIGKLANIIRAVLQSAVDAGIILKNYVITVPTSISISAATKATRILPSIPWTAELAGAIDNLTINGTLTA